MEKLNKQEEELKIEKRNASKIIDENKILKQLKKDSPELYKKYEEGGFFKNPKEINFSQPTVTWFENKMGAVVSERLSVDDYWMCKITMTLFEDATTLVGEDWLRDRFEESGGNYLEFKNNIRRYSIRLQKLKMTYDMISDKSFKSKIKTNVDSEISLSFQKRLSKIPLYMKEISKFFFVLINNSNLRSRRIPQTALFNWERKGIHQFGQKNPAITETKDFPYST